jgi:hypothetical protein
MSAELVAGVRPAGLWDALAGAASDGAQLAAGAAAGIIVVLAVAVVPLLMRRRAARRQAPASGGAGPVSRQRPGRQRAVEPARLQAGADVTVC